MNRTRQRIERLISAERRMLPGLGSVESSVLDVLLPRLGVPGDAGSRLYRRSKLRAVLDQLPNVLGPESAPLRFAAPDGTRHCGAHALLISNNAYRLGGLGHGAWRPHLDTGSLES